MTHEITDELIEHCQAVLHQTVGSIAPSTLDQAHRALFGFPEELHMSFGAKKVLEDAKKAAERIVEIVELQGATGWPTDSQEVARRAVGRFEFQLDYVLTVYGNDRTEIRKRDEKAHCSLLYTRRKGICCWVLEMKPNVNWVQSVTVDSESFRAIWLAAQGQLETWTIESGVSCQERRERDDEPYEAAKLVLEQEETPPERAQDPSLPEHPQEKHWV